MDLFVIVFIHDILSYSQSEEVHAAHLRVVLQTPKDHKFFAKLNKGEFLLQFGSFLCQMESREGTQGDS